MSFDLKKFNPYELSKRNSLNIENNITPSGDEYKNVMDIINSRSLTSEQYEHIYIMFVNNLEKNKISKTSSGVFIDLKNLCIKEFYHLENIICELIYESPHEDLKSDICSDVVETVFKPDCDYSSINQDLYVNENIEINTQQPAVSNYLELYDIQRSLPSLKK